MSRREFMLSLRATGAAVAVLVLSFLWYRSSFDLQRSDYATAAKTALEQHQPALELTMIPLEGEHRAFAEDGTAVCITFAGRDFAFFPKRIDGNSQQGYLYSADGEPPAPGLLKPGDGMVRSEGDGWWYGVLSDRWARLAHR